MKTTILTALLLSAGLLNAADPSLPDKINHAGALVSTSACCLPWKPDTAKEIAGDYECVSITDGSSTLRLKAASEGSDIVLSGKLETKWADFSTSVITFSRGELRLKETPHFSAGRDVITGWLVEFTNPEKDGAKPQPAIIIGQDIYVRTNSR